MNKITKVLGIINILLSVFLASIYLQFLFTEGSSGGGSWANLGFFLIMFVFLAIAIILTIPFLIIGFKRKFKGINFYLTTHLAYVGISVILFAISLA